jgi:hypothetical protein
VSQVGDVYAEIVGLCFVRWPPDLLEGLSLSDEPARVTDQDFEQALGWDDDRHQTVWTCKRCGATRRSDEMGDPYIMDPGGPAAV